MVPGVVGCHAAYTWLQVEQKCSHTGQRRRRRSARRQLQRLSSSFNPCPICLWNQKRYAKRSRCLRRRVRSYLEKAGQWVWIWIRSLHPGLGFCASLYHSFLVGTPFLRTMTCLSLRPRTLHLSLYLLSGIISLYYRIAVVVIQIAKRKNSFKTHHASKAQFLHDINENSLLLGLPMLILHLVLMVDARFQRISQA